MNIFDDDDFMSTSPKESYFSIAKTANQNIVEMELEKMFRRLAVAEKMLEEKGLEAEYESNINTWVIDEDVDARVESIFIELMGSIVTQCE
jgi:hypothetical protein